MNLLELLDKWRANFGLAKLSLICGYTRTPLEQMLKKGEISEKQEARIKGNLVEYVGGLVADINSLNK